MGKYIAVRKNGNDGPFIVQRARQIGSLAEVGFRGSLQRSEIAAAVLNEAEREAWDHLDLLVALHEIATEPVDVVEKRYAS